jgi:glycosidase
MANLIPLDFWMEARKELDAMKPLFWFGETEDPAYHLAFDASYTWEFLHTMEKFWRGEVGMAAIDEVLFNYSENFPSWALRVFFTSNHDENSHSGTEYERMGSAAQAFAVLCATWNGIPLIYSGQELPMLDKRLHFFDKDQIPWTGKNALHEFYNVLLTLRSLNPALKAGDPRVRTYRLDTTNNAAIFAFLRKSGAREIIVLLNLSPHDDLSFEVLGAVTKGVYLNVFSGMSRDFRTEKTIVMNKWEWLVFEK